MLVFAFALGGIGCTPCLVFPGLFDDLVLPLLELQKPTVIVLEYLGLLDFEVSELSHPHIVEEVIVRYPWQMDRNLILLEYRDKALELLVEIHTMHHVVLDLKRAIHHRVYQTNLELDSVHALRVLRLLILRQFFGNKLMDVSFVDVEEVEKDLSLLHHRPRLNRLHHILVEQGELKDGDKDID